MTPTSLYRLVARAEAVTWALLLLGMFLKYVTETTELGVRVFGMFHGVVFIAYCLVTVLLWIDRRWSFGKVALGLVCAILPFATIPFELHAERAGLLGDSWRLRAEEPRGPLETVAALLLRRPLLGVVAGLVALAALTSIALLVGPPA